MKSSTEFETIEVWSLHLLVTLCRFAKTQSNSHQFSIALIYVHEKWEPRLEATTNYLNERVIAPQVRTKGNVKLLE